MSFRMTLLGALLLAASLAWADQIVLRDGRALTGIVTSADPQVVLKTELGTITFPKAEVVSIEYRKTPQQEYAERLAALRPSDAEGLCKLAQWAAEQGLAKQSQEAYAKTLEANPDHPAARRALGFVKVAGKWQPFDAALEVARGQLAAGEHKGLLGELLPALEAAAPADRKAAVQELWAAARLASREFAAAADIYATLAKGTGTAAVRAAAMAELLKANPDGMVVLLDEYPSDARLKGRKPQLQAGPNTLADPVVVKAALLELARKDIETARAAMAEVEKLEATDPPAAESRYAALSAGLDKADALAEGIARSYKVELARRRVGIIRRGADADARKFDQETKSLGKVDLPPAEYKNLVVRLLRLLDNIRDDLNNELAIAQPYPQELLLEIQFARDDLKRIGSLRQTLQAELDAKE
jgi:hypothetical protein